MLLLLLGLLAALAVSQALCLLLVWREGVRAAHGLDEVAHQLGRSLTPVQEDLARASRNLAHVTDLAALEARRVDDLLTGALAKMSSIRGFLEHVALPLATHLGTVGAVVRLASRVFRPRRGRR